MKSYRVGGSWAVTIVRCGPDPEIQGRQDGDELVAVIVNGDKVLAQQIVDALNERERRGD